MNIPHILQIDLLKNTVVDGLQIFNARTECIATEWIFSIVLEAFSKGKQMFDISYKSDGNTLVVNQVRIHYPTLKVQN